jgi:uncharacterized protein (TIGR03437 family)
MRFPGICLIALLGAGATRLGAQPFIYYRGVVNGASFEGSGLPGGSIAQGSIFTIFGTNLGPAQAAQSSSYPLPNQLAGVSVEVVQGSATLSAIPIVVLSSQVSAIMPSTASLGQARIRVQYNGQTSNAAVVNVVGASPGLFTIASSGFGPGIVQNYLSATSEPLNTSQATAQPGQILILWGTGLGPVPYADNIAPTAGNLPAQVQVFVGNQMASVSYSGRSPCCSGLDQIVFAVPQNAPAGCYVPLQAVVNGVPSNAVSIAIGPAGAACSDSFNPVGTMLRAGGRNGVVVPHRSDAAPVGGLSSPTAVDMAFAALQQDPAGVTYFNPAVSLPPPGTCTFYADKAFTAPASVLLFAPTSTPLDGGAQLSVTTSAGSGELPPLPQFPQIYGNDLGAQPSLPGLGPLLFSFPGTFSLSIPGGADVQEATANGSLPAMLTWSNRTAISAINRASGLTVTWTGGNPAQDVAVIYVVANHDPSNSSAVAVCLAPVSAGSFSLPSEILASLPATPANAQRTAAWIGVGSAPLLNPGAFTAGGLAGGFIVPLAVSVNAVVVQ